jgi:hypothetical protein
LRGDGKKLSLVIKDYFDGVEKVIKKNKKVMSDIFYGYARSKRMTDNSWDEQIVNNIKVKKVHVISEKDDQEGTEWRRDEIKAIGNWPVTIWDVAIDLEIYTREVVKKEQPPRNIAY